jgi:hypothetical protein
MKKYFGFALVAILLACSLQSNAQKPGKLFSVGFGLEGGAPVNNAATAYSFTAGMTLRFSLHAGPGFATLASGWNAFIPMNIAGNSSNLAVQIPIKAGYKYIFAGRFFVMGEMGYSSFHYYYDNGDGTVSSASSGGFTYAPSVGVQFGVMEIGVRYETIALKAGNISYVGFRLGFNF